MVTTAEFAVLRRSVPSVCLFLLSFPSLPLHLCRPVFAPVFDALHLIPCGFVTASSVCQCCEVHFVVL